MKYLTARMGGALLASGYFVYYASTLSEWHFIDTVNLIFHEAGHTIFSLFGETVSIAMGSGFQILLPFLIALHFFFTRQYISSAVALMWTGQNFLNVSIYAGDSILMQLPLLGGDGVIHDWNYLLTTFGILKYTHTVTLILYSTGIAVIALGIALSIFFAQEAPEPTLSTREL